MAIIFPALFNPIFALLGIGLGIGAILGFVAKSFRVESDTVIENINDLLPQTQCGQCGYPGCKPYAEAIASGESINKCSPGGEKTILKMADLLNLPVLSLDESHGQIEAKKVAYIREAECIGCAKCIPACPVDAIHGAPKYMHTVIESECTGCDLCIEPCPVDCIELIALETSIITPNFPLLTRDHAVECINCGLCIEACPVEILPHELYRACKSDEIESAEKLNLMQCIECGKCDQICPSQIPLVNYYQAAKYEAKRNQQEMTLANRARIRFDSHQQRVAKLSAAEEQRRQDRAGLARHNKQTASKDNIQAALERVKAKRKVN